MAQSNGRENWRFDTLAVHGGYSPDPTTKAVAVPIYQTVAFAFDNAQHGADLFDLKVPGNIYSRIMNPTQDVLEHVFQPDRALAEIMRVLRPGGVHVFSPDGRSLGVIKTPETVANFTWGDPDMLSLFLTASTSLYRVRTRTPGVPLF